MWKANGNINGEALSFPAGTVSSLHDVRYKVSDSLSLAPHKCMLAPNLACITVLPHSSVLPSTALSQTYFHLKLPLLFFNIVRNY